jgi:hypothetical protein
MVMLTTRSFSAVTVIIGIQRLFYSRKIGVIAMDLPLTLTIEQQFNMKVYEDQVKSLSPEQAQEMLLELMRQMMIKDNVVKHLMKKSCC